MTAPPCGYDDFVAQMDAFVRAHPAWRTRTIGWSRQGRLLRVLSTGEGGMLIHAAHHANEWITAVVLLRWLWQARPEGPVTVVPVVNPDGVELVTRHAPAYDHWKANVAGVDLNLNYPAGWAQAVALKAALGIDGPGPRDWPGPSPLSEPETRAMARLSDEEFRRSLSLHSQGREIYWDYRHCAPAGARALAEQMARDSGYVVTTPPETASHGGYKDWFLLRYRRPAYTVELGQGENPLPWETLPQLCAEGFAILDAFVAGEE